MTPAALRQARADLGLTQPQMAAMLGRKLRNYQQWEWGERKIDEAAARLIALYLVLHKAAPQFLPTDWPKGEK